MQFMTHQVSEIVFGAECAPGIAPDQFEQALLSCWPENGKRWDFVEKTVETGFLFGILLVLFGLAGLFSSVGNVTMSGGR